MAQPVFYDPERARWKRLRRTFDVAGSRASPLLVIFFVYTALRDEPLPELLLLAAEARLQRAERKRKREGQRAAKKLAARSHRKSKLAASQVKLNQEEGIRAAFYVPWDAASFSSLREFARQIDLLYPDWLHVFTPDGRLQGIDEQTNKFFDVVQGTTVQPGGRQGHALSESEDTGHGSLPHGEQFRRRELGGDIAFLNDPDARALFRQQVRHFLPPDRYHGLMVDFEAFPPEGQPGYMALLQELSDDLHAKGMKLYVSVQAHNEDYNYAAIAARCDGVVLMNYDEHYPGAASGPVASQDWFVANLKFAEQSDSRRTN